MLDEILDYKPSTNWVTKAHSYIKHLKHQEVHLGNFSPGVHPSAYVDQHAIVTDDCWLGPGSYIGPFCRISGASYIGPGCRLQFGVEVNSAVLIRDIKIIHAACVCNSIIGPKCNLAFGFVAATRHLFGKPIKAYLSEEDFFYSEVRHHGSVIMGDVHTGVNVALMPGSLILEGARIPPGTIVSKVYRAKSLDRL